VLLGGGRRISSQGERIAGPSTARCAYARRKQRDADATAELNIIDAKWHVEAVIEMDQGKKTTESGPHRPSRDVVNCGKPGRRLT